MAEPMVIVAVRQAYAGLEWSPGLTPLDADGMRQLYGEDSGCHPVVQMLDTAQVAASVDAGYLWWGFLIGMSAAIVGIVVSRWGRKEWACKP